MTATKRAPCRNAVDVDGLHNRVETCRLPKSYEDATCIAGPPPPEKWSKGGEWIGLKISASGF